MLLRVMMTGGGTGGHLYPGLAVAERLRQRGVECTFVGTRRGLEARVVPQQRFAFRAIRARGLAGRPWHKAVALLTAGVGALQSWLLLRSQRPQLVVATGGYVCAPVLLACAAARVPVLMLEQNALPGKVNRRLGPLARRICVSYPESEAFFPAGRCRVTGNPVRQDILQASREASRMQLGVVGDRPMLLVTGASQGAASLNRAVLASLPLWRDRAWTVLHLTGPRHHADTERRARELLGEAPLDYRCFGYMEDMQVALAAADLVVARAGATTLAEITARGLPGVLVPFPFAAERHQDVNADTLVRRGAAVKLDDSGVEELLAGEVLALMEDSERRGKMAQASLDSGNPRALDNIIDVIDQEFGPLGHPVPAGPRKKESL